MIKINKILSDEEVQFLRNEFSFPDLLTEDEFYSLTEKAIEIEILEAENKSEKETTISEIVTKLTNSNEWL